MARDGTLPGVSPDSTDRVVCHVDMDCFYAACERLREPALRGEPVVVGMGYEPGESSGAVATASYEARAFGVESAQAISTALSVLPRKVDAATDPDLDVDAAGFYRPVDLDFYESVAEDVREVLRDVAERIRAVSIDEAYLDVTDRVDWTGDVAGFGRSLRRRIEESVGVTASVGVAPTMSAAKVASDHDKPDGLVVVEPGDVRSFLSPLDVEAVHGVGPVTATELREMGIETAGDLAASEPDRIKERFGDRGLAIRRFARGDDDRPVEPTGRPKSLSRESAFTEPTDDDAEKRDRIEMLAAEVAERARREDALYQTIGIKVVEPPFEVSTRARTLPGPVDDPGLLESVALDLLSEFDGRVRKLGVRVSNLSFAAGDQASLDGWAEERDRSTETDGEPTDRATSESATDPSTEGQRSLREYE